MACTIDRIKLALHEEVKNIEDITFEETKGSNRYALARIPEGPVKAQNANLDSIVYRSARPAPIGYRAKDMSPRPLIPGTMNGRNQANVDSIFNTDINDIDENNCHGQCIIDFAQGYRRITGTKYELDLSTPEKCARDFDRFDAVQWRYWLREFRNQFTKYGLDNYDENLLNFSIQFGESNTSIVGPNAVNFTAGGWQAPPTSFLSIHHLREWRKRIMRKRRNLGLDTPEGWMMEIEVPMEDWFTAVMMDQTQRYAWTTPGANGVPLSRVALEPLYDPQDGIRKRRYHDYAGIRAYFTEYPIKGYFRRVASTGNEFQFVRVFPYINEIGQEAGLVEIDNPDYDRDHITVDGIRYDLVVLVAYIDRKAFTRFPLAKPHREQSDGVNYNVKVVDGAFIPCNEHNDKFKMVARHEFGFRADNPELAGFLAYKAGYLPGYVNELPSQTGAEGPQDFATAQDFPHCGPDACSIAACAECGQVPDDDLQCVPSGSLPVEVLRVVPNGLVSTVFEGTPYSVTVAVERSGSILSTASVSYATAPAGTLPATAGTHYTTTTGTLSWAAGESGPKYITVPILTNTTGADKRFTITISSPTGATIASGGNVATVSIVDGVS